MSRDLTKEIHLKLPHAPLLSNPSFVLNLDIAAIQSLVKKECYETAKKLTERMTGELTRAHSTAAANNYQGTIAALQVFWNQLAVRSGSMGISESVQRQVQILTPFLESDVMSGSHDMSTSNDSNDVDDDKKNRTNAISDPILNRPSPLSYNERSNLAVAFRTLSCWIDDALPMSVQRRRQMGISNSVSKGSNEGISSHDHFNAVLSHPTTSPLSLPEVLNPDLAHPDLWAKSQAILLRRLARGEGVGFEEDKTKAPVRMRRSRGGGVMATGVVITNSDDSSGVNISIDNDDSSATRHDRPPPPVPFPWHSKAVQNVIGHHHHNVLGVCGGGGVLSINATNLSHHVRIGGMMSNNNSGSIAGG
eukprot:CAMPEP_0175040436 /NCGR_PEP_ID=MMETSP0052_2-20121109/1259_1 /TAXON_ID=51329 ORGANISM="Polytomella parva, Strain SAG 63-3" /NCGR_SAMPLE_ID=MMETSP0052_2 /ASSEMBLY_ACC=CAM_ASM_000194 /LENGTH=362 /DNA_ID=CAMNT_0016302641 /DNA_START=82 /DNA_END=1166 /DNA_ORIENTATION=+